MVNGISSYNNYMNYLQPQAARSRPDPSEMFDKIDTDGSGGISQSELDAFVQDLSDKTGKSIDATNAVSTYDTDKNGELSQDEFKSFMDASGIAPPPPPHGGPGMMNGVGAGGESSGTDADSVISAYDINGDGVLSSDELQAYLDDTGSSSSLTSLFQQAITAYSENIDPGNAFFDLGDLSDYSPVDYLV